MATSLLALRQTLGLYTGLMVPTVETTGSGSGTTAVSTNLKDFGESEIVGWYCNAIDSSTPSSRRISIFAQSTGTVTVSVAFAATPASAETIEIWKYNPALVDVAIKRTLEAVYPRLHLPFIDENLIQGNFLRDNGFEEWPTSTTLTFWTDSGANATLAQETTIKLYGTFSAKLTATAATQYVEQSESEAPHLLDLAGTRVDFKSWGNTATATNARLQIVTVDKDGNSVTKSSEYHVGDSRWHLLAIKSYDIPNDIRTISFRLTATDSSGVSYFDQARVTGPTTLDIWLPRTGFKDLQRIELQTQTARGDSAEDLDPCDDLGTEWPFRPTKFRLDDNGTDKKARLDITPLRDYKIRLVGGQTLTVPSSDTATTEIDSPQTEYLLALAAGRLYTMLRSGLPKEETDTFRDEALFWEREADKLRRFHQMFLPASYRTA